MTTRKKKLTVTEAKVERAARVEVLKKRFDDKQPENMEVIAAFDRIHPDPIEATAWTEVECLELLTGRFLTDEELEKLAKFHQNICDAIRGIPSLRAAEALRSHLRVVK